MHSDGFEPIASPTARVLILGTLPGQVSLQERQYYAQPRNAFWRIMGELFGAAPELSYASRTRTLVDNGIALWDVCASAQRPGSLDASIRRPEPNDFCGFFASHPRIGVVCFNGAKAAALYERHVLPSLPTSMQTVSYHTLPSTSPAHAAMPYSEKLARWSMALRQP